MLLKTIQKGSVMLGQFKPTWMVSAIYNITPTELNKRGIKLVLTDLDNTLIAWNNPSGTIALKNWMQELEKADIQLVVVSNNSKRRVGQAVGPLGLPFVCRALKPLPFGINKAVRNWKATKAETIMIGDQLLTDVLAANSSHVRSVLVKPIMKTDAWVTWFNRFVERYVMKMLVKKYPKLTFREDLYD